jgi:Rps23 Pro-64 3,4-dihydroxylase Tpa1-like proline 4-hydroxylase
LASTDLRDHFQSKLQIDLTDRPATVTVRGQTVQKNGAIHIDSRSKLVTVLIYLNDEWNSTGGRLRLLRNSHDLEDSIAEVPPTRGAMVAFVNTLNAWHGHKPFVGRRRSIQLNWVTDAAAASSANRRHAWSARVKRIFSFWNRPSGQTMS